MIRRLALACSLIFTGTLCAAEKSLPPIRTEEISSPAAPGAVGAALFTARDGTVWLTWIEPGKADANTLRVSTFDPAAKTWRAPHTIASGPAIHASAMDFPQLAADTSGRAVAVWTDGKGAAALSRSRDHGTTWSAPEPVTRESNAVEKFSVTTLSDDRVLLAWLDGRALKKENPPSAASTKEGLSSEALAKEEKPMTALYARMLDDAGPDVLVDPEVCDCCQTTLAPFLDGGALLAYRARTTEEVRDIRTARFRGPAWDTPHPLNHDDWRIAACPMNGPRLASDGGRVAAAWFTAADNDPRVLASFSPDAGARFLQPLRLDRGHPTGHVETLVLRDTAMLTTWLEADGSYWLRRISPDFTADEPFALAPAGGVAAKDFPRSALVRNYTGGDSTAQFIAAYLATGSTGALHTLLVTVPEGGLLVVEKDCDCAPTPEQLIGFPLRGTIAEIAAERGTIRVKHGEVPGLFAAGIREFHTAPAVLAIAATGREFIGHVEQREGAWWLVDVRLLARAGGTN